MNTHDVLSTIRDRLSTLGERAAALWRSLNEIEFDQWGAAIREKISGIDFGGWIETIRTAFSRFELDRLATAAAGTEADPTLRIAAGALALGALGTAVLLTLRMLRQRRATVAVPVVTMVPVTEPEGTSLVRVVPRRTRAPHRPRPSRSECMERVGRLANHGATQAQVARAIGLSRDALAILTPAIDWTRPKLPSPARSSVREQLGVSMQRRFTRRVVA
jgi:hypothetical protein